MPTSPKPHQSLSTFQLGHHPMVLSGVVFFLTLLLASPSPTTFDCSLRSLALEYALKLQPTLSPFHAAAMADALNGSPEFGNYNCNITPPATTSTSNSSSSSTTYLLPPRGVDGVPTFYVDATTGSDTNPGTLAEPFLSIAHAVEVTRGGGPRTLLLRAGTFFLASPQQGAATIVLGASDSGLTLAAYPGESVWVSGAAPLPNSLVWQSVPGPTPNVWSTILPPGGAAPSSFSSLPALRALTTTGAAAASPGGGASTRLHRARFPNADPETQGFVGFQPTAWLPPTPPPSGLPTVWTECAINRTDMNNGPGIQCYTLGVGGGCAVYDPPAGFWCSNATTRFSGFSAMPRWPSGLYAASAQLPHAPYAHPQGAIVHAWRSGHWFTRQHVVGSMSSNASSGGGGGSQLLFSGGGFQGGEGEDESGEMWVEGVMEELDAPGEYHYNATTRTLTLCWNSTTITTAGTAAATPTVASLPPPPGSLAAPLLRELFNITGSQATPVVNVSFLNLGFRDTSPSYLQPHGLPSGGDWALARTGALFFEGTEGARVEGCTFERLDGTALLLSGYSRGAVVAGNAFAWLGESAIALWGWGEGSPVPRMGPNLTAGNVPLYTTIEGNVCREIGVWQKQSSCVFQAEAGLSRIARNLMWNGPRAAVNFNEDSIGGSALVDNVGFNFCRESGDHGFFNSWGRLPYLHNALGTGATTQKLWDEVSGNLVIANYNAMAALDHDDASAYYNSTHNVFAYSPFALKSDFGGHDQISSFSVYAYLRDTDWFDGPAMVWSTFGDQFINHTDHFHHNLVVMDWCQGPCSGGNLSIGQVCRPPGGGAAAAVAPAGAASAAAVAGAPFPPPLYTNLTLTINATLDGAIRHCDFSAYVTGFGNGDADDYVFTLRPALSGTPGAFSFTAKAYPTHYLAVTSPSGALAAVTAPPSPLDASWVMTEVGGGGGGGGDGRVAFTLTSLTTIPGLVGSVLTRSGNLTGACAPPVFYSPAKDAIVAMAAGGKAEAEAEATAEQVWTIYSPPIPPPPPGIGFTDIHDNLYYLPAGGGRVFECGVPLEDYQASCSECDPGSKAFQGWPEDSVLIDASRAALGM